MSSRNNPDASGGPIVDPAISHSVEKLLERVGAIQTGHFVLSSGLHSDRYCQCARLFEDPAAAAMVARLMKESLPRNARIQTVLGPAMGGVIWAYELARELGARALFCERAKGASEGFQLRRGFRVEPGERVLIAEDVITTGKSVLEAVPVVREVGAELVGFACVVDRSRGSFDPGLGVPTWALCELEFRTWPAEECPMDAAGLPIDRPGSRPADDASRAESDSQRDEARGESGGGDAASEKGE
jgi:orotate phosphoribosyltransferase